MDTIIFSDKKQMPDTAALKLVLGKSYTVLEQLNSYIETKHGAISPEWKFYSLNYGWTMKTMLKKRNLFFLSPRKDFFIIGFTFGDKAINVIMESQLPNWIKTELQNARKYAEGRGIGIEVRNTELLENLKSLVNIKVRN